MRSARRDQPRIYVNRYRDEAPGRFAAEVEGSANAHKRGFGAAETAQEKTGKTVPVPTRKSVSADCPALDALRLLPPHRASVPHAPKLSSGKGTVSPVFSRLRRKPSRRQFERRGGPREWTRRPPRIAAARKKTIPKPLPKRSKRAWGAAKGGAAIGCRFRGSLRRHGVFGSRFFSLRRRFVFRTFVAAQRACFFRKNDPSSFVGRCADPVSLRRGLVSEQAACGITSSRFTATQATREKQGADAPRSPRLE